MLSYHDDIDIDEAADTLRMRRFDSFDSDPDATSIYDIGHVPAPRYMGHSPARRRQIRDTRENVLRLQEAIEAGWDVGPELAFEKHQLAILETR